jgi:hypothetical protein
VHREYLLGFVIKQLMAGAPLPEPAQEWLVFVLGSLRRDDAIPTLAKGRPVDFDARGKLYRGFLLKNNRKKRGKLSIGAALERAAWELNRSPRTIRNLYYSDAYASWRVTLRSAK